MGVFAFQEANSAGDWLQSVSWQWKKYFEYPSTYISLID